MPQMRSRIFAGIVARLRAKHRGFELRRRAPSALEISMVQFRCPARARNPQKNENPAETDPNQRSPGSQSSKALRLLLR